MSDACVNSKFQVQPLDFGYILAPFMHEFKVNLDWALAVSFRVSEIYNGSDSTRDIIQYILQNRMPMPFCLPDSYVQECRRRIEWYREELMVKSITDTITDYERTVMKLLENIDCQIADIVRKPLSLSQILGVIKSLPRSVEYATDRNNFDTLLDSLRVDGEFYGTVGERKNFKMKLVSRRYLKAKGFYVVNGVIDGKHLVVYFDTRSELERMSIGDVVSVRASIKEHKVSDFTKCKETRISRVVYS